MKTIVSVFLLFPFWCTAQILNCGNGPPVYISATYAKANRINCLSFTETWTFSKHKKRNSSQYKILFDTSGNASEFFYRDHKGLARNYKPDYLSYHLVDKVDTVYLKEFLTVTYDTNMKITMTSGVGNATYYRYDTKGRLAESTSIRPEFGYINFVNRIINYDSLNNPIDLFFKSGKYNKEGADSVIRLQELYHYVYKDNLLTNIITTRFTQGKFDHVTNWIIAYKEGVMSTIDTEEKAGHVPEHFSISIERCN